MEGSAYQGLKAWPGERGAAGDGWEERRPSSQQGEPGECKWGRKPQAVGPGLSQDPMVLESRGGGAQVRS